MGGKQIKHLLGGKLIKERALQKKQPESINSNVF